MNDEVPVCREHGFQRDWLPTTARGGVCWVAEAVQVLWERTAGRETIPATATLRVNLGNVVSSRGASAYLFPLLRFELGTCPLE